MARSITASEVGIELKPGDDGSLFKWFIASFLMGKRIQAPIAAQAYKVIVEEQGRDTARQQLCRYSTSTLSTSKPNRS